jgi:hypothetical protein
MASVFVAIDRATKVNGCLQMMKGSQRLGRQEHSTWGDEGAERTGMLPQGDGHMVDPNCVACPSPSFFTESPH